jgi:hypothetical protein
VQFTSMNGLAARVLEAWIMWATRPLPVPVSPLMSTGGVSSSAAIWRACSRTARSAADSPMTSAKGTSRAVRLR